MTTPRTSTATVLGSAWTTGTMATRSIPLTAGSPAGDTRLALLGANNSAAAIATATDTGGNQWTRLYEHTTGPYTTFWLCEGHNGGPDGGPTTALAAGDQFTWTQNGVTSMQAGGPVLGVSGLGPYIPPYAFNQGVGQVDVVAQLATDGGETVMAWLLAQATAVDGQFDPPFEKIGPPYSGTGHVMTFGWARGVPAGVVNCRAYIQAAANSRLLLARFAPPGGITTARLRRFDGAGWQALTGSAASRTAYHVANGHSNVAQNFVTVNAGDGLGAPKALPRAGDVLWAIAGVNNAAQLLTGVRDSAGASWLPGPYLNAAQQLGLWTAVAPRDYLATDTFTADFSTAGGNRKFIVVKGTAGVADPALVAQVQPAYATTLTPATGPFPVTAPALVIAASATGGTGGPGTGLPWGEDARLTFQAGTNQYVTLTDQLALTDADMAWGLTLTSSQGSNLLGAALRLLPLVGALKVWDGSEWVRLQ
jgi:hypothetical protein